MKRRFVVLTIEGNFHGRSGLSIAASDPRVSPHHTEGFGPVAKGFGVLSYKGGKFKQVVTDGIEHGANDPKWDEVAAVILAPVLGNNVVKTYSSEFWEALDRVREETGTLIIHDDVQAGSGRAGHYASWQGTSAMTPDVLTLGKGLALGFPMSATLASEEVAESFSPGLHFNTFGGSPFICFLATRFFKWLDENINAARLRGRDIRHFFAQRDCWIREFDGAGLLNAFTPDFDRFGYNGFQFCREAQRLGLGLITHRAKGPIRFIPRLNAPTTEIRHALALIEKVHFNLREKAIEAGE
jgi:acetylornithine/succinyldiaminopimelate/putrescine aminotransferase